MRLIDVDALIEKHCEGCSEEIKTGCKTDPVCATLMWFEDAPAIDAVPVVRCKDCACYAISPMGGKGCLIHYNGRTEIIPRKPDDFCSYGERKDGCT